MSHLLPSHLTALKLSLALTLLASACFEPPEPGVLDEDVATPETLEVCQYIGGLNRLGFRGEAGGLCATLVLVENGATQGPDTPNLTLPSGFAIETQSLVQGPCEGRAWTSPHEPERTPHGKVTLGPAWNSAHSVDVRFTTGSQRPSLVRLRGSGEPAASCRF